MFVLKEEVNRAGNVRKMGEARRHQHQLNKVAGVSPYRISKTAALLWKTELGAVTWGKWQINGAVKVWTSAVEQFILLSWWWNVHYDTVAQRSGDCHVCKKSCSKNIFVFCAGGSSLDLNLCRYTLNSCWISIMLLWLAVYYCIDFSNHLNHLMDFYSKMRVLSDKLNPDT